jgi:hypothetical protein
MLPRQVAVPEPTPAPRPDVLRTRWRPRNASAGQDHHGFVGVCGLGVGGPASGARLAFHAGVLREPSGFLTGQACRMHPLVFGSSAADYFQAELYRRSGAARVRRVDLSSNSYRT